MVINGAQLDREMAKYVAEEVSYLSREKNSSLLPKTEEEVLLVLASGIVLVKVRDSIPLFLVAFELTGNKRFVEVGMTCNLTLGLESGRIKGREVFPEIIFHYRQLNGNGGTILYLTTTDVRMASIALGSGFEELDSRELFPEEVLKFCCSPCGIDKTGVECLEHQIERCPRFLGEFVPDNGNEYTRLPCKILVQAF